METDAADGNPLRTRIPTAAWKAQNAFHSSHKARRRLPHRIHFSLGRRMGSTSNIKQQVCQFQTVSTEGFTPPLCANNVLLKVSASRTMGGYARPDSSTRERVAGRE